MGSRAAITTAPRISPGISAPHTRSGYPDDRAEAIQRAVCEAWAWLKGQGLLAAAPDASSANAGWVFVTPPRSANCQRGNRQRLHQSLIPALCRLIHPRTSAMPRAQPSSAVTTERRHFRHSRKLRSRCAQRAAIQTRTFGTHPTRKAFDPQKGELNRCHPSRGAGRQGLSDLGGGRDRLLTRDRPHSHRTVTAQRSNRCGRDDLPGKSGIPPRASSRSRRRQQAGAMPPTRSPRCCSTATAALAQPARVIDADTPWSWPASTSSSVGNRCERNGS